jgi:hypothetical protein
VQFHVDVVAGRGRQDLTADLARLRLALLRGLLNGNCSGDSRGLSRFVHMFESCVEIRLNRVDLRFRG